MYNSGDFTVMGPTRLNFTPEEEEPQEFTTMDSKPSDYDQRKCDMYESYTMFLFYIQNSIRLLIKLVHVVIFLTRDAITFSVPLGGTKI